ncbi:alpha/beta hydrolase [Arthrobacter sp. W4I7]|uniref:alpha/beta hydrolase n=1 Tax=Arthrobacter sp. W4I7 TaxID=3042296 RepID=UPI002780AB09|nr:alpha/beta hydrolase [Arthrobacter sp. W4I7]MDQ0691423.1 acetyl esterase [Arthrobacter sp. W4I7]
MALNQATQAFVEQLSSRGGPPMWELEPTVVRKSGETLKQMCGPGPDMERVDEATLTSADGGTFRVRVLVPSENPTGVIAYSHGGGWVTGNIDEFDTLGRQLAKKSGAAVILVDYRKSPENPYPAAVNDVWTALNWADQHRTELAGADAPLIIAGDSAGGNLAAVIARWARDKDGPKLDAQVLVYPVTDAVFTTTSYRATENQLLLNARAMEWYWGHYCPPEDRDHPDVSPLRASDFSGLPPAIILLAEHDVLHDEGSAYANRLEEAGVPTDVRVFKGQMHGFFTMANLLPGSAAGVAHVSERLAPYLNSN